jgi:hydroxymethylglutaryl-CoA lyase
MDMPFIETLEEARHFIKGPAVYESAPSPWKEAIKSPQRPETMHSNGDAQTSRTPDEPATRWLPS